MAARPSVLLDPKNGELSRNPKALCKPRLTRVHVAKPRTELIPISRFGGPLELLPISWTKEMGSSSPDGRPCTTGRPGLCRSWFHIESESIYRIAAHGPLRRLGRPCPSGAFRGAGSEGAQLGIRRTRARADSGSARMQSSEKRPQKHRRTKGGELAARERDKGTGSPKPSASDAEQTEAHNSNAPDG